MSYQNEMLLIYVLFLFTLISYLSGIIQNEKENEIVFIFIKREDYYIEKQNIKRINVK
jgi:hypothetical protein